MRLQLNASCKIHSMWNPNLFAKPCRKLHSRGETVQSAILNVLMLLRFCCKCSFFSLHNYVYWIFSRRKNHSLEAWNVCIGNVRPSDSKMASHFMHVWWVRDDAAIRQAASVAVIFGCTDRKLHWRRMNDMRNINEMEKRRMKNEPRKIHFQFFFFKKNKTQFIDVKFYF